MLFFHFHILLSFIDMVIHFNSFHTEHNICLLFLGGEELGGSEKNLGVEGKYNSWKQQQ